MVQSGRIQGRAGAGDRARFVPRIRKHVGSIPAAAGHRHLDRVGVEDDFFQIGGDSIRSIQAQAQAKRRGLNFALQALFKHHTIRQLVRNTALAAAQPASIAGQPFALLRAAKIEV